MTALEKKGIGMWKCGKQFEDLKKDGTVGPPSSSLVMIFKVFDALNRQIMYFRCSAKYSDMGLQAQGPKLDN
jgi:hypothetical protein